MKNEQILSEIESKIAQDLDALGKLERNDLNCELVEHVIKNVFNEYQEHFTPIDQWEINPFCDKETGEIGADIKYKTTKLKT